MKKAGSKKRTFSLRAAQSSPQSGLFYTSLDHQQTKSDQRPKTRISRAVLSATEKRLDRVLGHYEHCIPLADDLETNFRHGRWINDRNCVREALRRSGVPATRLQRFDACGADAWIQCDEAGQKFRIKAFYCGDRFCKPCAAARSRKVAWSLSRLAEGKTLRFVTLTLRPSDEPLAKILDHLHASFQRLRCQRFWRSAVDGGVAFVEITRGAAGDHWHVHLHVLVCGRFINQVVLSDGWQLSSGGSYIVDVRSVSDNASAVGYVAKYATKGFDNRILSTLDATIECILALRGRRMFSTVGRWRNCPLDGPPTEQVKWKSVGSLCTILKAALRREAWAVGALKACRLEPAGLYDAIRFNDSA